MTATPTEKKEESSRPYKLIGSLGQSVGLGTFFYGKDTTITATDGSTKTLKGEAYWQQFQTSLTLMPAYSFSVKDVKLSAGLRWAVAVEESMPDLPMTGRRFMPSDVQLSLSAPTIYKEKYTGITVSPTVRATIPSSWESIGATNITNAGVTLSLGRSFLERIDVGYGFGFTKGFYVYPYKPRGDYGTTTIVDPSSGQQVSMYSGRICREDSPSGICASGGMNTNFSISNRFDASVKIVDRLSVSATCIFVNAYKYAARDDAADPYAPPITDVNGNPIAQQGAGRSDQVWGLLSVDYEITPNLAAGLAMTTVNVPLTADNKALRFPFFDGISGPDNITSFGLSVTGTY